MYEIVIVMVNLSIAIDYAEGKNNERRLSINYNHVEIDDYSETGYGEAIFNPEKFPDPAG